MNCKYYKQKKQVSYDNGVTWYDLSEYRTGSLYESGGTDCNQYTPIYRWVNTDGYMCNGTTKYARMKKQVSNDNGVTYTDVVPATYMNGSVIEYNSPDCGYVPSPYSGQYLTIESIEDGNEIRFDSYDMGAMTISASTDNGQTWSAFTANDSEVTIATVNNGDKVLFKGLNERYYPTTGISTNSGCFIVPRKSFNVYGNIMSLVSGDTFTSATSVTSYAFRYFFAYSEVADASNLVLPATTLANNCYRNMFSGCESLTVAPELPATTLAEHCYYSMFNGCTSLNYIKCLATDKSANWCTSYWVDGVSATGTFVKASSMSGWSRGTSGIPSGWTVQNA